MRCLFLIGLIASSASAQTVIKTKSDQPVVIITQSAVPTRYQNALPVSAIAMQSWVDGGEQSAPVAHVIDKILAGDPLWFGKLSQASRDVSAVDRAAWSKLWIGLFAFETAKPAFCKATRPTIAAKSSLLREVMINLFVKNCANDEDRSIILRPDTPSGSIIDYYDPWRYGEDNKSPAFDQRLVEAARGIMHGSDTYAGRRAAFALVGHPDPRAESALIALHKAIVDPAMRIQVGMAFHRGKSDQAKQIARAACVQKPDDPMCQSPQDLSALGASEDPPKPTRAAIAAQIAKLQTLGFERVGALNPAKIEAVDPAYLLGEAGYGYNFDVETGLFPNQHDRLMRNLAALVSPELRDAIFEEKPPITSENEDGIITEAGGYHIIAYHQGKRYETTAEDLGDWYDVIAVLRLMNAIMADQRSDHRFHPLSTSDQTLTILAASSQQMKRASAQGLISLGDARKAEALGKGIEAEVFETLTGKLKLDCVRQRIAPNIVVDNLCK